MKKRNQIKDEFKWDTSHIYSNLEIYEKDLKIVENGITEIPKFKGKLGQKNELKRYFEYMENLSKISEKLGAYVYLNHSEDMENQKYVEMLNGLNDIETKLGVADSFVDSELLALGDEKLDEYIADPDFKVYKLDLMELKRSRAHVLPEEIERVISMTGDFAGEFSNVFDNIDTIDVKFEPFEVNGKKYVVNNSNYSLLLEDKNPEVRYKAFKNLMGGYMKLTNTIATNYIANVKKDKFYTNVYKFDSTLDSSLFGNNLSQTLYSQLIDEVRGNVKLLQEYLHLRKKALGLKVLEHSDLRVAITKSHQKPNYEKMCDTILKALNVLGENYIGVVKNAIKNRWIDVYPTLNKDTGGYCLGVYGVHPYILLNTVDNLESMFTLVHEMGHAMHSHFSDTSLPYNLSQYPIFLAEIASTTNEVLLLKYLYGNAKTKDEKVYLLDKYLQMFRTTIFRQTMFSEFEDYAHKLVENSQPISKEKLVNKYGELVKFYHGTAVRPNNEIAHEWLRIPHFYRSYYVFKYATGLISAISLANHILKDNSFAGEYIKFLSSGGSDYPLEILKRAGVDLTTKKPYEDAFSEMKWALKELKNNLK